MWTDLADNLLDTREAVSLARMAEQSDAGLSSSMAGAIQDEQLHEAEQQFQQGIQAIKVVHSGKQPAKYQSMHCVDVCFISEPSMLRRPTISTERSSFLGWYFKPGAKNLEVSYGANLIF